MRTHNTVRKPTTGIDPLTRGTPHSGEEPCFSICSIESEQICGEATRTRVHAEE